MTALNIFISGLISGIIIYQSFVVASTVFKSLELKYSSIFLRSIFPKFFTLISILGFICLALNIIYSASFYQFIVSGLTVVLAIICYVIIPATNKATDDKDKNKFRLLHTVSVVLTLIILILHISIIGVY
tara:strand:+ start:114 stop:503 length:390 start_codon:yes stop_codon:yes gene_type:complete